MQRHDRHEPAGRATVGCTGRKKQAVPVLMADALEREGLQGATLYHGSKVGKWACRRARGQAWQWGRVPNLDSITKTSHGHSTEQHLCLHCCHCCHCCHSRRSRQTFWGCDRAAPICVSSTLETDRGGQGTVTRALV